MPLAIYAFSLCAFALGFTEFVVIGLVPAMALDLGTSTTQVGAAVTAYALGVSIGGPVLTALTVGWKRRLLLAAAMVLFIAGNLAVALSPSLVPLLGARFASGLAHGVFLAVASSVAAAIAGPARAGSAVALVFGGLTVALVLGVPAGTFLGSLWSWRAVFGFVTLCASVGLLGLLFSMPRQAQATGSRGHVAESLRALAAPRLLGAALLSVLAYTGTFAAFTYISPLLIEVTGLHVGQVSALLLAYGVAAALGNIAGGRLTDRFGADTAVIGVFGLLSVLLLGIWAFAAWPWAMVALVSLLGAATFAAVPALQARIMDLAAEDGRGTSAVAAGLNIAGFNIGIALGSVAGGWVIGRAGYASTALLGAAVVACALPFAWRGMRAAQFRAAA